MKNKISNQHTIKNTTCLICLENIESPKWCKCVKCNIIMHNLCEKIYRNQKRYCECPHCRRIGTIGSYRKVS